MSAAEELRELTALQKGYQAEISACKSYLNNHERWASELAREEQVLAWQQRRVDALRRRHGPEGEEHLLAMQDRLAEVSQRLVLVRNRAAIEAMLKLAREIDELNGVPAALRVPAVAACAAAAESDGDEVTVKLVCDGCGHVVHGSEDLVDTACPRCDGGILTDPGDSDDVTGDELGAAEGEDAEDAEDAEDSEEPTAEEGEE